MKARHIAGLIAIAFCFIAVLQPVAAQPVISGLKAEPSQSYMKVSWSTDVDSDTKVEYGINDLSQSRRFDTPTKSHVVFLTGIQPNTEYKFKATSCNEDGCSSSEVQTFRLVIPDTTPPLLRLKPVSGVVFANPFILNGSVNEQCLLSVRLNGKSVANETHMGNFGIPITLFDGENRIEVIAKDAGNNTARASLTVRADVEPIKLIESNLARLDMSTTRRQTLRGVVSKPNVEIIVKVENKSYSTKADSQGRFSVEIELEGDVIAEGRLNHIVVLAKGPTGRIDTLIEGSITFMKCGSGSGWISRLFDLSPAEVLPDHLMAGIAQFGFRMDFQYIGGGRLATMDVPPSLTVQEKISEEKKEGYDEELFSGAVVTCSQSGDKCHFVVTLKPWTKGRKALLNKSFISLPLIVRVQYSHEIGGKRESKVQEECIEINLFLDRRLIDIYKPSAVLNTSITLLNNTISVLGEVKKPIETVKTGVMWGCVGASVYDFVTRLGMVGKCITGGEASKNAYYEGRKTCPDNSDCNQDCLDALWGARSSELARNWLCDRLFCPAAPTLEYHKKTYTDPLTKKESRCVSGSGAVCEDEYKYAWDSTGLFVNEYARATNQFGTGFWSELDQVIMQSNQFCPALKGFPSQVVKSGTKEYYINEKREVYEVRPTRFATQTQGETIKVYDEQYTIIRGPLDILEVPQDIQELIMGDTKEKNYVFDPTAGIYEALMGGCLPAITGYISHWQSILGAVKQCLEMVQKEGEGTPGVCKAILSTYVCDVIWDSVRCLGLGLTAGSGTSKPKSGIMLGLSNIAAAAQSVSESVTGRYGNTGMYDAMFRQRKLVHGACIAFFTGDLTEFDLNAMFSAEVGMPTLGSEGLIAPATRRYITSNPFKNGWATFIYHIGYAINAGSNLNYELSLVCGNDLTCPEFGRPNGACDCYDRGERITRSIASGALTPNQMANEEKYITMSEGIRFDRVVLEWSYTSNTGEQVTQRTVKKIKDIGAIPPAHCKFSEVFKEYRCEAELAAAGVAFFINTPKPTPPVRPEAPNVFRVGDKLSLSGEFGVQYPAGATKVPPKFLLVAINNHAGTLVSNQQLQFSTPGTFNLESYPELFPVASQEFFISKDGVSECSKFPVSKPARWEAIVALMKAKEVGGGWERSDEVEMYEGRAQFFKIPLLVACQEGPSPGTAPPRITKVTIKKYVREDNNLLGEEVELGSLADNAEILLPSAGEVLFPQITVSGGSGMKLKLIAGGTEVLEKEIAAGTHSITWKPEMGGVDIKTVTIQFELRDESGQFSRYPASPKPIKLKRTTLSPIS